MFVSIVLVTRSIPRKNVKALRSRKGQYEGILEDLKGHMERIRPIRIDGWFR